MTTLLALLSFLTACVTLCVSLLALRRVAWSGGERGMRG